VKDAAGPAQPTLGYTPLYTAPEIVGDEKSYALVFTHDAISSYLVTQKNQIFGQLELYFLN
jgi:hypothetical protein